MPLFEHLHGLAGGAELSNTIKTNTMRFHGEAGRAFIERCTQHAQTLRALLKHDIAAFTEDVTSHDSEGQVKRVAQRMGLIGLAGEIATAWGLTGWDAGESMDAVRTCFNDWISSRVSGGANSEKASMIEAVETFIMKHADSRFTNLDEVRDERIVNRAGWKRKNANGLIEYSIIPDVFKKEVCAGFDYLAVAKALDDKGLIKTSKAGSGKRYSTHQKIDGVTMLLFRVDGAIFPPDEYSDDLENTKTLDPLKSCVNRVNRVNPTPKPAILGALAVNTNPKERLTLKKGVLTTNKNSVNRETLVNTGFAGAVNTVNTVNTEKTQFHKSSETPKNPSNEADEIEAYKHAFDSIEVLSTVPSNEVNL